MRSRKIRKRDNGCLYDPGDVITIMSLLPMLGEVMPEEFQSYAGFITDLGPIIQEGKTAELGLVLTQKKTAE